MCTRNISKFHVTKKNNLPKKNIVIGLPIGDREGKKMKFIARELIGLQSYLIIW